MVLIGIQYLHIKELSMNMNKFIQLIRNTTKICKTLCLMGIIFLSGCVIPGKRNYTLENNSENSICAYIATGFYEFGPTAYPDTVLPKDRQITGRLLSELISTEILPSSKMKWPPLLNNHRHLGERLPLDTLSVFILSFDTLKKYGYEDVRVHNRIMVRYDLSYDEVRDMNWDFYYPPREFMKNMKMYPPYSEIMKKE